MERAITLSKLNESQLESSKDWIPKKQTTFPYGQFTSISGRFLPAT